MKHEFDDYAADYRKNVDQAVSLSGHTSTYFAQYKAQKLKEWFRPLNAAGIMILDFGCGDGLMANFVQEVFYETTVIGVDPAHESIKQALAQFPHITFAVTDGQHLPFPDHSFDLIYSAGVFHHIPFEEHAHHIKELMRVLKPHGSLVIFELNPYNPLTVLTFKRNPIDKNAHMLRSAYSRSLLKPYGIPQTTYYCFFPKWFSWLMFMEPYLAWLPLGALYATIMQRKSS